MIIELSSEEFEALVLKALREKFASLITENDDVSFSVKIYGGGAEVTITPTPKITAAEDE